VDLKKIMKTKPTKPIPTPIESAQRDLTRLEKALKPALKLAAVAASSCMRAGESLGFKTATGTVHPADALMGLSERSLYQARDACRFARHSLTCPH